MTDQYQQTAWSLSDLFPSRDSAEMQAAFNELEDKVKSFEQCRFDLKTGISKEAFLEIVHAVEGIRALSSRIGGYAQLSFSGNTQDQAALNFMSRVEQFMAGMANRTLFFSLWWKDLPEAEAERLMKDSGDFRYWLEEMRLFKPHTLSEAEEKIINIKDVTGVNALQTLYETITNRYVFKLNVNGEEKELTRGELMVYVREKDPAIREAAYKELYRVYQQDSVILGQIYQTLMRDWRNEQVDLRHFPTPISARNLGNAIPDDVVETLLDVCEQNAPLFQRFFRLKASWLGVEHLRRYDIYAPMVEADKRYEFDQAADKVFDSFSNFDERMSKLAKNVFGRGHVDSEVRHGKSSGAFCASISPDLIPWVLLSYQGRSEDVTTMAHELGHAIHAQLASDHNIFAFHSTLPLAETASTFGEMMLVDRLLDEEKDENVRLDLLFRQLDGAYATIIRQAFFALFERQAHEMINANASIDELSNAYFENLQRQFGDAVELSDEFRWEWISIPHIFSVPFYVYAYAFGQLLVFSLYKQYKDEGESFKPRYMQILAAGSSDSPERILARAGIDIHSAAFWQGGFDVVEGLIEQLESIQH